MTRDCIRKVGSVSGEAGGMADVPLYCHSSTPIDVRRRQGRAIPEPAPRQVTTTLDKRRQPSTRTDQPSEGLAVVAVRYLRALPPGTCACAALPYPRKTTSDDRRQPPLMFIRIRNQCRSWRILSSDRRQRQVSPQNPRVQGSAAPVCCGERSTTPGRIKIISMLYPHKTVSNVGKQRLLMACAIVKVAGHVR